MLRAETLTPVAATVVDVAVGVVSSRDSVEAPRRTSRTVSKTVKILSGILDRKRLARLKPLRDTCHFWWDLAVWAVCRPRNVI